MTNVELANAIRHNLFADRKSVKAAWDYAFEVINSINSKDRAAAMTAVMVLMNTISNEILKNEEK